MRTIGLIGGMSWESTQVYYRLINQMVNQRLGGLHSAKIVMVSVDFAEIERLQHIDDWQTMQKILSTAAHSLEKAGAECVVICTNTMHKLATEIEQNCTIPLIHIADACGNEIQHGSMVRVGLLGTRFTMEQPFYTDRLYHNFSISTLTPNDEQRQRIHQIIYQELCKGIIRQDSKDEFLQIIQTLVDQGAQGIILGCTEIPMLIKQQDCQVRLLDTTYLHAKAAVDFALN